VHSPRRFLLGLVAVALCVCGSLAVLFLFAGDFDGASWQILTTTVLVGLYSLLALPGATLLGQARGSILAWSAIILAALSFLWAFRIVWADINDDASWRLLVTLTACSTAVSQVCAMTGRRHENDPAAVDRLYGISNLLAYAFAATVTLTAWDALGAGPLFWRVLASIAVLDLLAVLLQPVLRNRARLA
jgi:hypothetical protein